MELKKIQHSSAISIGVVFLVIYFVVGLVQLLLMVYAPEVQAELGTITPLQALVIAPVVGGIVIYLITFLVIVTYNAIARSYPITWNVK